MTDSRHFEKPLNRHNSAMKFGMMTRFDPAKPRDGQKFDFKKQDGG